MKYFALNKTYHRLCIACIFLCIAIFIIITSFKKIETLNSVETIWLEAEEADNLASGLKIINDSLASGEKAIISDLPSHKVEAYATYSIQTNIDGTYQLWARCNWLNGCGNAFQVNIENTAPVVFGKDPVYNVWHWVKGPVYNFNKGKQKLLIWNDERFAKLDKLMLTNDPNMIPQGFGESDEINLNFDNGYLDIFEPNNNKLWSIRYESDLSDSLLLFTKEDFDFDIYSRLLFVYYLRRYLTYWINLELSDDIIHFLKDDYDITRPMPDSIQELIIFEMNKILKTKKVYNEQFFTGFSKIELSPLTYEFINDTNLYSKNLIRVNRMLLEQAFPEVIKNSPGTNNVLYTDTITNNEETWLLSKKEYNKDFVFRCDFKFGEKQTSAKNIKFIYNYQNKAKYKYVSLTNSEILFCEQKNGKKTIFKNDSISLINGLNKITIICRDSRTNVKLNNLTVVSSSEPQTGNGKIGICTHSGDIYFDNIEVTTDFDPIWANNLFSLESRRNQKWKSLKGHWYSMGRISYTGNKSFDDYALEEIGEEYWQNYSISSAIRGDGTDAIGLSFYVQNKDNYYLFRSMSKESGKYQSKSQIVKIKDGKEYILSENLKSYKKDIWYKYEVRIKDNNISAYIDDDIICSAIDSTFSEGKIGLWTSCNDYADFNDINIQPIHELKHEKGNIQSYLFEERLQREIDYSAWNIYCKSISQNDTTVLKNNFINRGFRKNIFETAGMKYKHTLRDNFKIDFEFWRDMPQDVNINIACQLGKNNYRCNILNTEFYCYKNSTSINHGRHTKRRFQFSLQRENTKIKVYCDKELLYDFEVGSNDEDVNFELYFDGPGTYNIQFEEISIQDNIEL